VAVAVAAYLVGRLALPVAIIPLLSRQFTVPLQECPLVAVAQVRVVPELVL
jgi:hypothetical protein